MAAMEVLEARTLLSSLTVTTTADVVQDGDGLLSLREAMLIANDDSGVTTFEGISSSDAADTIQFDASLSNASIDLLGTQLPAITSELTIAGPGAHLLTIDAQGQSRIFEISTDATATISGLTLTGGHVSGTFVAGGGGGIVNLGTLAVTNCTLSDNSADFGGGLYNIGMLTVADSTILGNSAGIGGGIYNLSTSDISSTSEVTGSTLKNNSAVFNGGGIFSGVQATPGGTSTVTVTGSTIEGNSASAGGGIYNGGVSQMAVTGSTISFNSAGNGGGAIWNFGTLDVINSTLSSNAADVNGGGIYHDGNALTATNSTIVLNHALVDGGGVWTGSGTITTTLLSNTIVAGNVGGESGNEVENDLFGDVESASANNLIGDTTTSGGLSDGVNGNIVGAAFEDILDPILSDNGGPTLTHALVAGSPAIDAGRDDLAADSEGNPLTFDQRGDGFARIVGSIVDIGAYEVQNQVPDVTDFTKVGAEDNLLTFSASDFTAHFVDADGDPLVAVRIETLPAGGTLELDGMPVSAGQLIAVTELDALVFVPHVGFHGETTLMYTATDGIAGFATTPAVVTLDIRSVSQQVSDLQDQVCALATEGVLNSGQANSLKVKLNLKRQPNGDAGKIGAFINHVNALLSGGILSQDQADDLLVAANSLLLSVTTV